MSLVVNLFPAGCERSMAHFFAVRLKCDLNVGTVAVVLVMEPGLSHGAVAYTKPLVQCRCRYMTEARIESRYKSLIESRSGCPGLWPFVLVIVAGAKSQKM